MRKTHCFRSLLVLLVLLVFPAAFINAASKIGDPAKPLSIGQWISGSPVEIKAGTNIYVVQFWGTLSSVSRSMIPLMNQVHTDFGPKGVIVVGISGEPGDKITEFLRTHKPPPQYTIAADDKRKTLASYLAAFGQTAIPYCFVIGKDNTMLWHGVPQLGLTNALQQIISGTYNLDKAIKSDAPRAQMVEYLVQSNKGDSNAKALGQTILRDRTNSLSGLYELAYRVITDVNNTNRDFALAKQALDAGDKLAGKKTPPFAMARGLLLFEQGDQKNGIALAQEAVDMLKEPREKAVAEKYLATMRERQAAADKSPKSKPSTPGKDKPVIP